MNITELDTDSLAERETAIVASSPASGDYLRKLVPIEFLRISKHRGGRAQKKRTPEQRKRWAAAKRQGDQAAKSLYLEHQADARALLAALDGQRGT